MGEKSRSDGQSTSASTALGDMPGGSSTPQTSFRLLDLPRELRDLVYEKMLFPFPPKVSCLNQDKIRVVATGRRLPVPCRRTAWSRLPLKSGYEDGNPYQYIIPAGDGSGDPDSRQTYRLATRQAKPDLNIFLANKMVFKEAQQIFYSINNFNFSSVLTCLAFLLDRSPEALHNIRSVELSLSEKLEREGDEAPCASLNQLNFARRMCQIFSQGMNIRQLKFDIRTNVWDIGEEAVWRCSGGKRINIGDELDTSTPDWTSMFFSIKNLDSLAISWDYSGASAVVGRTIAAVRAMRTHMVKNGQNLKNQGIRVRMRHCRAGGKEFKFHRISGYRYMVLAMQIDKHGKSNVRSVRRVHRHPRQFYKCGHHYTGHSSCLCQEEPLAEKEPGTDPDAADEEGQIGAEKINEDGSQNTTKDSNEGRDVKDATEIKEVLVDDDEEDRITADGYGSDIDFEVSLADDESYTGSDFGDTDSMLSVHGWSDDEVEEQ